MRRHRAWKLGGWLWLALWVNAGFAAERAATPVTATRHSLWRVTGKSNAVYLLGSVHVLRKENYPLAAPIETAFTNAGIVVFETDIEALENPAAALKIMGKARLPEGETLRQQLSPEAYQLFTEHLKDSVLPAAAFEQFTPAMAAMTLELLELQKLDLDPAYGVDKHFFRQARKAGKEIVPLETVDFQIELVTGFSKEEGELLMKTTLRDMDNLKKDLGELLKAWETGDANKLEKLLNEATKDAPAIYKRLLTDRNERWLPKIEELLRGDKNAIVIVGAGHLVGKDGVVELLRRKGYKVTQE